MRIALYHKEVVEIYLTRHQSVLRGIKDCRAICHHIWTICLCDNLLPTLIKHSNYGKFKLHGDICVVYTKYGTAYAKLCTHN